VLERTGRTLTRAADAAAGDLLRTQLAQGALKSRVVEKGEDGLAGGPARRDAEGERGRKQKQSRADPTLFE